MSKPLALVYYSNLLPGSQLAGRLLDLGYRVQSINNADALPATCESQKPLVVVAEVAPGAEVCAAIVRLKANPATQHIPVLGFLRSPTAEAQTQARAAGVSLLASDAGIAEQLPQLLDQILQLD
jgi:CheY-like chemotaxis protein